MLTPCTKVCKLVQGMCVGCRRTVEEITLWARMTDLERKNIMEQLDARDIDRHSQLSSNNL